MRNIRLLAVLFTLFALALTTASVAAQGRAEIVATWGEIPGQNLLVHAVVVVPSGANRAGTIERALAAQGARPASPSAYTLTGLTWPQFGNAEAGDDFVSMNYNSANDPLSGSATGDGADALAAAASTWTGVVTSKFALDTSTATNRCPSLVKECPGRQVTDGNNDFA
jgi:hypothetical protein